MLSVPTTGMMGDMLLAAGRKDGFIKSSGLSNYTFKFFRLLINMKMG